MTILFFCQIDPPMSESFWQKDRMATYILFDLCLFKHFSPVANFGNQSLVELIFTQSMKYSIYWTQLVAKTSVDLSDWCKIPPLPEIFFLFKMEIVKELLENRKLPKTTSYLVRTITIIGPIILLSCLVAFEAAFRTQQPFGKITILVILIHKGAFNNYVD